MTQDSDHERFVELVAQGKVSIDVPVITGDNWFFTKTPLGQVVSLVASLTLLALFILSIFGSWLGIAMIAALPLVYLFAWHIAERRIREGVLASPEEFRRLYEAGLVRVRVEGSVEFLSFPDDWREVISKANCAGGGVEG
ncbi:MAG: hypothetical protein ACR2HJ_08825 [Fimbriimonadales bacterium]